MPLGDERWKEQHPPQAGIPDLRQVCPSVDAAPKAVQSRCEPSVGRHRPRSGNRFRSSASARMPTAVVQPKGISILLISKRAGGTRIDRPGACGLCLGAGWPLGTVRPAAGYGGRRSEFSSTDSQPKGQKQLHYARPASTSSDLGYTIRSRSS
jgi:hypothetical protein